LSSAALPTGERFGYLLKVAQHALRTAMDDALRPVGVTTSQYAVLTALDHEPGLSNADLARLAFVTAQSMQGIVANMERDKLIVRGTDPAHKRILRTELTSAGRKALTRAEAAVAHIEEKMLDGLDTKHRAELNRMLKRCAENAQKD
jgi:DNA-binding MarR family transcriptional regulator